MEAGEFIDSLETTGAPESSMPVDPHRITVRLTEAEHTMLQRIKELTGQDDNAAMRTGLRLFTAMTASGDTSVVQEIAKLMKKFE